MSGIERVAKIKCTYDGLGLVIAMLLMFYIIYKSFRIVMSMVGLSLDFLFLFKTRAFKLTLFTMIILTIEFWGRFILAFFIKGLDKSFDARYKIPDVVSDKILDNNLYFFVGIKHGFFMRVQDINFKVGLVPYVIGMILVFFWIFLVGTFAIIIGCNIKILSIFFIIDICYYIYLRYKRGKNPVFNEDKVKDEIQSQWEKAKETGKKFEYKNASPNNEGNNEGENEGERYGVNPPQNINSPNKVPNFNKMSKYDLMKYIEDKTKDDNH